MKNFIYILIGVLLVFTSCKKETTVEPAVERACYTYYVQAKVESFPAQNGYPQYLSQLENTFCNLTEAEALEKKKSYESQISEPNGNYLIITTTYCTMTKN